MRTIGEEKEQVSNKFLVVWFIGIALVSALAHGVISYLDGQDTKIVHLTCVPFQPGDDESKKFDSKYGPYLCTREESG